MLFARKRVLSVRQKHPVFFVGEVIRSEPDLIRKKSPDFLLLLMQRLLYTDSARLVKIIEIQRRIEI